jgi:hypothetical protein
MGDETHFHLQVRCLSTGRSRSEVDRGAHNTVNQTYGQSDLRCRF